MITWTFRQWRFLSLWTQRQERLSRARWRGTANAGGSERVMRRRRRVPGVGPTRGLSVEHPQLVVDALGTLVRLDSGRLLLLLGSQVTQDPVYRRYLRTKGKQSCVFYFAVDGYLYSL